MLHFVCEFCTISDDILERIIVEGDWKYDKNLQIIVNKRNIKLAEKERHQEDYIHIIGGDKYGN